MRNAVFAFVLPALAGCSLAVDVPGVIDVRRKRIALGPAVDTVEPLEDFPVAVFVTGDQELAERAALDNLQFFSEDGESLAHEVERFDRESGSLAAWVRVPIVPHDRPLLLYLHYGGPAIDPVAPSDAWPDSYVAVWHFSDTGPDYTSSSGSGDSLTVVADTPVERDGVLGGGLVFTQDSDQRLRLADPGDGRLDFGTESFAHSAWVRSVASTGTAVVLRKGGQIASESGYATGVGSEWRTAVSDGTSQIAPSFGEPARFVDRWTLLAMVLNRDGSVMCAIADGSEEECVAIGSVASVDSAADLEIGVAYFGAIDEVRIHAGQLQRGALTYEHQNLTRAGFVDVGPEELVHLELRDGDGETVVPSARPRSTSR